MDLIECTFMHMGKLTRDELRVAIAGMDQSIRDMPNTGSIDDCPVRNWFQPGVYCREITMPEGLIIVGRIHRHSHLNILSEGRCVVLTEGGYEELQAPCTFISEAGTKRVVYCSETTVWTTIHANPDDEQDVGAIIDRLTVQSYDDIELRGN